MFCMPAMVLHDLQMQIISSWGFEACGPFAVICSYKDSQMCVSPPSIEKYWYFHHCFSWRDSVWAPLHCAYA